MKKQTILKHANGNQVTVREGWCWLAFFFPLFWALYYQIWPVTSVFLLMIGMKLVGFASEGMVSSLINLAVNASYFVGVLIMGVAGNDMKLQALKSQGYFDDTSNQTQDSTSTT